MDIALDLVRRYYGVDYTMGSLYIDGRYFCDTLEDTVRKLLLLALIRPKGVPVGARKNLCPHGHPGGDLHHHDGIQPTVQAGAAVASMTYRIFWAY